MLNGWYNYLVGNNTNGQAQHDNAEVTEDDWVLVENNGRRSDAPGTTKCKRILSTRTFIHHLAARLPQPATVKTLATPRTASPVFVADVAIESVESSDSEDMNMEEESGGQLTPPAAARALPAARVGGARQAPHNAVVRRQTRAAIAQALCRYETIHSILFSLSQQSSLMQWIVCASICDEHYGVQGETASGQHTVEVDACERV